MSDNPSEPSYTNKIPIVNNFNLRNYLSPSKLHEPTPASTPNIMPTFTDLDSNVRQFFTLKFLAALTNRDSILREIRDCFISNDEERCRKLSKHVHAHWKSLGTRNGCIFVESQFQTALKRQLLMYSMLHTLEVGA